MARFDLDVIARAADRTIATPLGSLLLAFILYRRERHGLALGCTFTEYLSFRPTLRYWLLFVLAKTINRALTRLVLNHGWRADRPKWSGGKEIVVITGAGGSMNIGEAIVKGLLKKTNKIAIIDLNPPAYKCGSARFYRCDVSDEEAMHETAQKIRNDMGDPTIVIANAGIIRGGKIIDTPASHWLQSLKVNTIGAAILFKEFLPAIIKRNHGHFVTVGSSASYMSIAQNAEYSASKSAVLALHETLGQELYYRYNAPKVRTTFVGPTKVRTALGATLKDIDMQFLAPTILPEDVADALVKQIDSGLSGHIVQPWNAQIMLPPIRSLPEWYRWFVNVTGKTYETVTDDSVNKARKNYKVVDA